WHIFNNLMVYITLQMLIKCYALPPPKMAPKWHPKKFYLFLYTVKTKAYAMPILNGWSLNS
ncbi:MAG: hypothetical protein IJO11_04205, partial [Alphaproteobacteria bacterium]|nr:hypothetical protein [Alphaproteobacteria bacterium]